MAEKVIIFGGGTNPTGTIISFMGNNAPKGYLKCDGTVYNISSYPNLANHFLAEFGSKNYFGGNGTSTFAVPNLQGEFLRCTGTNSHTGEGSGSDVGTHQAGTIIPNLGVNYGTKTAQIQGNASGSNWKTTTEPDVWITPKYGLNLTGTQFNSTAGGMFKAKPTNTSVWYMIKY